MNLKNVKRIMDAKMITIQSFISELGSWENISSKINDPGNLAITTKNNSSLEMIVNSWNKGTFDEDPEALVDRLNSVISKAQTRSAEVAEEAATTDYIALWKMKVYNDGNSGVRIKSSKENIGLIESKYIPALISTIRKDFEPYDGIDIEDEKIVNYTSGPKLTGFDGKGNKILSKNAWELSLYPSLNGLQDSDAALKVCLSFVENMADELGLTIKAEK